MQTTVLSSLPSLAAVPGANPLARPAAGAAPFADALQSALTGVDNLRQEASAAVTGLIEGSGVEIHDAMIATQKADMAFELALAVRNKAVAAYQQVMSMQF